MHGVRRLPLEDGALRPTSTVDIGSGEGDTDTSASVYGLRGVRITSSAFPISMIRPRYMTAMRSAITQASDRSWVMKRYVSPRSQRSASISRSSSVRIETSSIDTGSSATMSCGPDHERTRDDHPLALPAGQLVGIAGRVFLRGPEAGRVERAEHALAALARRSRAR